VDGKHEYLINKDIQAFGLRQSGNQLLVPTRDADSALWSLQTITPNGEKRFKAGGKKTGHFHLIGAIEDRIIICEGYATAASIHQAIGDAVAVAFDCHNILPVAKALRERNPVTVLVIAADNEQGR